MEITEENTSTCTQKIVANSWGQVAKYWLAISEISINVRNNLKIVATLKKHCLLNILETCLTNGFFNYLSLFSRTAIACGSICSSSKGCSAFQFNKKEQTCSIGSQEDMTFAASSNAQVSVHLDADYVPPDYGKYKCILYPDFKLFT